MNSSGISLYRKQLIYRRSKGKNILKKYLSKIEDIFPSIRVPNLTSLEEADIFLAKFNEQRLVLSKIKTKISPHEILDVISTMGEICKNGAHVFIDDDWQYCGALKITQEHLVNNKLKISRKINDDILFISNDMSSSINFDFFEIEAKNELEITKWM